MSEDRKRFVIEFLIGVFGGFLVLGALWFWSGNLPSGSSYVVMLGGAIGVIAILVIAMIIAFVIRRSGVAVGILVTLLSAFIWLFS